MNPMKEFITAVQTDAEFNEEIHALQDDGKMSAIIEAAARRGFTITKTDFCNYLDNRHTTEELSEEHLENVVGGSQGNGSGSNPFVSDSCWFFQEPTYEGHPHMCRRLSCKKPVREDGVYFVWYQCHCYGTSNCIGKRHCMIGTCT